MLRFILFDIAFLSFGGALLISTIDMQGGLVSLSSASSLLSPIAKHHALVAPACQSAFTSRQRDAQAGRHMKAILSAQSLQAWWSSPATRDDG